LPEIPATIEGTATTGSSTTPAGATPAALPAELPANIPTARYPDDPATAGAAASQPPSSAPRAGAPAFGSTPPAATTTPQSLDPTPINIAAGPALSGAPPTADFAPAAAAASDAAAQSSVVNPLRQQPAAPAAPTISNDRYGAAANATLPTATVTAPSSVAPTQQSSFSSSWPAIQASLDRGELARAHQLLSPWHNEPTLTPEETAKVETLLAQLAGTVVYSTEHQLEPARVVRPGESLETIANEYNVPWQLLAKINSVPASDQVRPGQELKVIKGPFSAVVDLRRSKLSLEVGGRYAGEFPVTVPDGSPVKDGEWVVAAKTDQSRGLALIRPDVTPSADARPESLLIGPPALAKLSASAATAGGVPAGPQDSPSAVVELTDADATDVSDILSVGSRVVIRR
jgi:LysM repeat protein